MATVSKSLTVAAKSAYSLAINAIPTGSSATPANDIQTWLHCADIWDKTHTTISQVLADESTLLALISSNNAADYMARSTNWASSVCANATAMGYIGNNDYCANKLLANSTWLNAIRNSTYMESVLNVKVPTMTSNTAPYGVASASSIAGSGYEAFRAFDNNDTTQWASSSSDVTNGRLQYKFVNRICPKRVTFKARYLSTLRVKTFSVLGSNDGTNWETIREMEVLPNTSTEDYTRDLTCVKYYLYLALGSLTTYGADIEVKSLQFYGRA